MTGTGRKSFTFRGVTSLLIAVHRVFPHGGLQRDALATAREARRRGLKVTIVTQAFEGVRPVGIEVEVMRVRGASNHARARRFAERLSRFSAREQNAVVLGFDKMPGLDLYFAGDRCFVERVRAERGALARWTPRYRTFSALERAVFRPAAGTRILALSEAQRDSYRAEYGTPLERFAVLPPGIAEDRKKGGAAGGDRKRIRGEFGLEDGELLALLLGSDFARKGLDRAIDALVALPAAERDRVRLLAVGEDDGRPFTARAANAGVGDRVTVVGARSDVPALLAAADVLVHPARTEAGGAVLLEALVSGTPVIATEVCGYAPHIAASGAGVVLDEPFSPRALAAAISHTLTTPRDVHEARALAYSAAHPEFHAMHGVIVDEVLAASR